MEDVCIKNHFNADGSQLGVGVTALATLILPPETRQREIVAWCRSAGRNDIPISARVPTDAAKNSWRSEGP